MMSRGFLVFVFLYLPFTVSAAPVGSPAGFEFDSFMTNYHGHPDPAQIPAAMDAFAQRHLAADPGTGYVAMTFFSLVFAANPDHMPEWKKHLQDEDILSKAVLEMAVFHSHEPDWILKQPFHTATTNDMYWAAYFATGDARYVQKVIDQLGYCDEHSDFNVYLVGATAEWSLAANARQHPAVRAIIQQVSQSASGSTARLLNEALTQAPEQIHAATIETLKAGKASGSWKVMPWEHQVSETERQDTDADGKPRSFLNDKVVDYFLDVFAAHIGSYPPKFASETEKIEVLGKLQDLLYILDNVALDTADDSILLRAARTNVMAYNVDTPGSYEEAMGAYQLLLKRNPNDAEANYGLGAFLTQTSDGGTRAIPYLLKARELGILGADYSLGFTYSTLGDKDNAIKYLQRYRDEVPADAANTQKFIDALKSGETKIIH